MTDLDTVRALNPSALAGVRFLVSKRIEELEEATATTEDLFTVSVSSRDDIRQRMERLETQWQEILSELPHADPEEVDTAFRELASARADFAAVEERQTDLARRIRSTRADLEVLRSVYRSLDDLMASTASSNESTSRLRNASRQVFQIIEEERMRIARDMHDGPAQSMANLVLQAEILERLITRDPDLVAKELDELKNGVRHVLDETRRLIFDLRPMTLDDLGLVPTLRKFVKEFGDRTGVPGHLRVVGAETRLPGALEPTLFRIIQEALNNAGKHARASSVEVVIMFQARAVTALVRDDGIGMDVEAVERRLDGSRTLGLISMRERADLEKGRLEIRSQVGKGTEVRATFDL